ncbi:MAG: PQQ-dependent sugar dehydrogenase, partial [Dehalococcoidia bacterium]
MTIAMVVALTLLAAFVAGACGGQPQDPTPTATTSAQSTSVPASPTSVPPSPTPTQGTEAPEAPGLMAAGAGLALPPGFGANVFFVGLTSPTSMTFSPDGTLFVSQEDGAIVAIIDFDGDGRADGASGYARGFTAPLGLVFHEGALYVSSRGSVTIIRDDDGDGQGDVIERIISGLPNGPHQNNGLAFGPDGMLYLTLGSTCNACIEEDPRSATIMRFNPDGSGGEVFARGLRNVYDIAFHPLDGTLFGADNGRDEEALGVPEELNLLVEGADYGWP